MRGAAGGKDLSSDSLLQYTPNFESVSKANRIITHEHTTTIENMIKLCVLGEYWDDITPRALPNIGSRRGGGQGTEVNQDKSKLGLGELYEREYLKKAIVLDVYAKEK